MKNLNIQTILTSSLLILTILTLILSVQVMLQAARLH